MMKILLMKVVHIQKYGRMPILASCPPPTRQPGQFLVKLKYAPVNPSDLNFYLGLYGIRKEGFPIMGFEGSGIIKQCESDELRGRKVSVLSNMHNGTYGEYIVSNSQQLIIWPQEIETSLEDISMSCINPLSVLGMVDAVQKSQAETVVLSAAASNTSRMLTKFLSKNGRIKTILGLSRSSHYDEELKSLGFKEVYRMDDFQGIKKQLKHHGKSVFLDCVGGNFAGQLFNVLPPNSMMVNYGRLSRENLGSIDIGELYYRDKTIRGFWLKNFLQSIDAIKLEEIKRNVIYNSAVFKQKIRQIYPIEQFQTAMRESIRDQSEGKILLKINN